MIPEIQINKGDIFLSKPNILGDIIFNRSVVVIVDYNTEGIVGFMINKPLNENLKDLIPDITVDFKVFDGGPVDRDKLYFIHNVPQLITGGYKINENLYWGGDQDQLIPLVNNRLLDQSNIKFFLGYSGWTQIQLEDEIKDEAWLKQNDISTQEIINCDKTIFWNDKIRSLGGEYLIWSNAPDNPNYN